MYRNDDLSRCISGFIRRVKPNLHDSKVALLKETLLILFRDIYEEGKFCETICDIEKNGIDIPQIICVLELLQSINNSSFNSFKCLNGGKVYEIQENSFDVINEIFYIFHKLIRNNREKLAIFTIKDILAQLANINCLSRSLDPKCEKNVVYHFRKLKSEYLNPDFITSPGFSQEGEDLVLKRLFSGVDKGFYVDVGAHHPTRFSNTYLLYCKGWRGINIEPFPGSMDLFNSMRPKDINIEAAVGSPKANDCQINYVILEETAYNYVINGNIEHHENFGKSKIIETVRVPIKKLDDILDEYARSFEKINLLNIDTEGNELDVFKGFSIKKYLPDFIIVEIRGFSFNSRQDYPIYGLLNNSGYQIRSVLFNSIIFEKAK
jgi:FkbM family methyltransferase